MPAESVLVQPLLGWQVMAFSLDPQRAFPLALVLPLSRLHVLWTSFLLDYSTSSHLYDSLIAPPPNVFHGSASEHEFWGAQVSL